MTELHDLKKFLSRDLAAADFMTSCFVSAAISFKQDSLLVPFPKIYLSGSVKDFDRLASIIKEIPALEELLVLIISNNCSIIERPVINLLSWIMTTPKYSIETVARSNHQEVLSLTKSSGKVTKPSQIFKVNYFDAAETKFQKLKSDLMMDTKFAYHGTKFCNIYPILNYGLQQHLNKVGLYGEGLYFAQELEVSLLFSPSVTGWIKSTIGESVSSVAICEYINDPKFVKARKENAKNSDIPHNYLLIRNNELVRVRYVLIYGNKKSSLKTTQSEMPKEVTSKQSLLAWCRKNSLIIAGLLYILLLSLVGLSKNRVVEYYVNNLMEFLSRHFKFL